MSGCGAKELAPPPAPEIRVVRPQFNPALFYLPPLPPPQPIASQRDAARLVTILHASLLSCRANLTELERINAMELK